MLKIGSSIYISIFIIIIIMIVAAVVWSVCWRDSERAESETNNSAISFLRQLTTWHCPHPTAVAAAAAPLLLSAGRATFTRHLLLAGPTAANPQQRRAAAV